MSEDFNESFRRLQSDIASQTPAPPIDQIAHVARRRHNTRLAAVATAVVMAAGSTGWLVSGGTPMSADPIDQPTLPTEPEPTPNDDVQPVPASVWMTMADIPPGRERFISNEAVRFAEHHASRAESENLGVLPPCVPATLEATAELDDIYAQTAWYMTYANSERHFVHHHIVPGEVAMAMLSALERCVGFDLLTHMGLVIEWGVDLYRVEVEEPYLVAIGHSDSGFTGFTVYVGPAAETTADGDSDDPYTPLGLIASVASRVSEVEGEPDPFVPTEVPAGVWLDHADVSVIDQSRWSVSEPVAGIAEPTPSCFALDDLDGLHHQVATSDSGDLVIQYAVISELSLDLERRMSASLEACALQGFTVEALGGWDGTTTSTTVLKLAGEGEWYLLASNHTRNGAVFTIYQGSRVDVPVPAELTGEVEYSEMTLIMRDLAGKGSAFNQAYIDNCFEAGACDENGRFID